jgi:hypothetical protein
MQTYAGSQYLRDFNALQNEAAIYKSHLYSTSLFNYGRPVGFDVKREFDNITSRNMELCCSTSNLNLRLVGKLKYLAYRTVL